VNLIKIKKINIVIIGVILSFSCFQSVHIPTFNIQEEIEDKNVLLSSPDENLPTIDWKSVWPTADYDYGLALDLDSLENVHITGYTGQNYPNYNLLYVKYDKEGNLQNSMTLDVNPNYDAGQDITLDSSDNIYIAGYTDIDASSSTNYNTYITKISSIGVSQWEHIWGGSGYENARTVALDSSENVYIGGLTWSYGAGLSDALIIKYTNAGAFQ